MLRELITLIEPHKDSHSELYEYLTMTWTACHYNSTLYACNVSGATCLQYHLSEFDKEMIHFHEKEKEKGFNL